MHLNNIYLTFPDPPPKRRKISSGEDTLAKVEDSQTDGSAECYPNRDGTTSCQSACSSNSTIVGTGNKDPSCSVSGENAASSDNQFVDSIAKEGDDDAPSDKGKRITTSCSGDGNEKSGTSDRENAGSSDKGMIGTIAKGKHKDGSSDKDGLAGSKVLSMSGQEDAEASAAIKENAGAGPSDKQNVCPGDRENAGTSASPIADTTVGSNVGPTVSLPTGLNVSPNANSCGPSCNSGTGPNSGSCSGPSSGPIGGPCNGLEGLKDKSPLFWLDQLEKTVRDILDMLEVKS